MGFGVVNLWLGWHLFAIIVCPASASPASPLAQAGWSLAAPYLQALYLNHGFRFFAPEPAGSTLVDYELEFPDGSKQTGRIPDRAVGPRLLYHRYFMLTEFLGNGPEDLRPLLERAFARNLCRETGASRVSLTKVFHDTPSVASILAGKALNDDANFLREPLGSYSPQELAAPYQPPTIAPPAESELLLEIPPAATELAP
ncbi:MAG: hypothetical protein U0872_07735 [Planctomycetaceae bacterium]